MVDNDKWLYKKGDKIKGNEMWVRVDMMGKD